VIRHAERRLLPSIAAVKTTRRKRVNNRDRVSPFYQTISNAANVRYRGQKSRRYLLTDARQFDILQFGPGWQGTECNSIN
jgi:hypothetical protein